MGAGCSSTPSPRPVLVVGSSHRPSINPTNVCAEELQLEIPPDDNGTITTTPVVATNKGTTDGGNRHDSLKRVRSRRSQTDFPGNGGVAPLLDSPPAPADQTGRTLVTSNPVTINTNLKQPQPHSSAAVLPPPSTTPPASGATLWSTNNNTPPPHAKYAQQSPSQAPQPSSSPKHGHSTPQPNHSPSAFALPSPISPSGLEIATGGFSPTAGTRPINSLQARLAQQTPTRKRASLNPAGSNLHLYPDLETFGLGGGSIITAEVPPSPNHAAVSPTTPISGGGTLNPNNLSPNAVSSPVNLTRSTSSGNNQKRYSYGGPLSPLPTAFGLSNCNPLPLSPGFSSNLPSISSIRSTTPLNTRSSVQGNNFATNVSPTSSSQPINIPRGFTANRFRSSMGSPSLTSMNSSQNSSNNSSGSRNNNSQPQTTPQLGFSPSRNSHHGLYGSSPKDREEPNPLELPPPSQLPSATPLPAVTRMRSLSNTKRYSLQSSSSLLTSAAAFIHRDSVDRSQFGHRDSVDRGQQENSQLGRSLPRSTGFGSPLSSPKAAPIISTQNHHSFPPTNILLPPPSPQHHSVNSQSHSSKEGHSGGSSSKDSSKDSLPHQRQGSNSSPIDLPATPSSLPSLPSPPLPTTTPSTPTGYSNTSVFSSTNTSSTPHFGFNPDGLSSQSMSKRDSGGSYPLTRAVTTVDSTGGDIGQGSLTLQSKTQPGSRASLNGTDLQTAASYLHRSATMDTIR